MGQDEFTYRTFKKSDEKTVRNLVRQAFPSFLDGEFWEWKYLHNASFDPSLVAVAERNGEIVGCDHWLSSSIRISSSLVAKAVLCGDFAVDRRYRKRGVGKSLLLFARKANTQKLKDVILTYMFAEPELSKRLYGPWSGYFPVPSSTVTYAKRLSWNKIAGRLERINAKSNRDATALKHGGKGSCTFLFKIPSAPLLTLSITEGKASIREPSFQSPRVTVETDLATLISLRKKKRRARTMFTAWLARKLKVKPTVSGFIRLYRNRRVIEEILG